jgi:pSer/pThr/pTyr-binding forkhead associated (FHA) protein
MNMKVIFSDPRHGDQEIALGRSPVLVGRDPDAVIQVLDCFASRHHCEISERNGAVVVRDLGSTNGLLVNGCDAYEALLNPGDTLSVGATNLVVCYDPAEECEHALPTSDGDRCELQPAM